MKKMNLPNLTLIALVASCLAQVGAQLFALSVVASTVSEAPPRSFAMLQGEYGYNSSAFWDTVPMNHFRALYHRLGHQLEKPTPKTYTLCSDLVYHWRFGGRFFSRTCF